MTTRNLQIVESDLSGQRDASTITLGYQSTWYEVDLTEDENRKLAELIGPYLKAGRKTNLGVKAAARRRFVPDTTPAEREEIRAWARAEGYELTDRGRIPMPIYNAYKAAHESESADAGKS